MEYYMIKLIYRSAHSYAIWYTKDVDRFITKDDKIILFESVNAIKVYCDCNNIKIDYNDITSYDFDYLINWCKSIDVQVDCNEILNFWNIISDGLNSVGVAFSGDDTSDKEIQTIYDKLFYGCNLEALNSKEKYFPQWTKKEICRLKNILLECLKIL